MGGSRIYIGNVSLDTDESHLREQFSRYGSISNLEIKSKFDIEGKPISRFAYVNLESDSIQINKCIHALNGYNFKGSTLKVEVARESFLERLKREREQNNNPETNEEIQNDRNNFENENYNFNTQPEPKYYARDEYNDDSFTNQQYEDYPKRDRNQYDDDSTFNRYNKHESYPSHSDYTPDSNHTEEQNNQMNILSEVLDRKRENFVNKQDPKTFSTFKRYDPTAPENQESAYGKPSRESRSNKVEPSNTEKFVQVSSDLSFKDSDAPSSFSLLDMFSQKKEAQEEPQPRFMLPPLQQRPRDGDRDTFEHDSRFEEEKMSSSHSQGGPTTPKPKSRNFFISNEEPELKDAVEWLLTPLNAENKSEFEDVRHDLVTLYKLRNMRAEREAKATKRFRNGARKGNESTNWRVKKQERLKE